MKPVVLPMLHLLVLCLLGMRKNSDRFARYIGLRAAADSQHSLEFVRENFDEPRDQLVPVVENPLSAAAARQFSVTRDQVSDDLDILTVGQGGQSMDEYISQFQLWSVISAPLILGLDVRTMSDDVKRLVMPRSTSLPEV